MNLIFVYGPPAVGKFTVGSELAKLTGYRFFHNHLTVPLVDAIFADKCPERSELLKDIRLRSIAKAAAAGIDLIFTAAYSGGPKDEAFIQQITETVEATPGGRMMYVQLHAPENVLLERVSEPSRAELGLNKMTDPQQYERRLRETKRDILVSVKYEGVLLINTEKRRPHESAHEIVRHFQLASARPAH